MLEKMRGQTRGKLYITTPIMETIELKGNGR